MFHDVFWEVGRAENFSLHTGTTYPPTSTACYFEMYKRHLNFKPKIKIILQLVRIDFKNNEKQLVNHYAAMQLSKASNLFSLSQIDNLEFVIRLSFKNPLQFSLRNNLKTIV